ncbi:uncharacterized protein SOCE26_074690 [Sorangium cellulosum]|uniref:Uncharacterized protein n=1 Tax=Sorangium cellulosum TaxID=56 RepID=A0A2L0F359_SORCE|nr:uncharacterized protein SOCE26_074690 [Sorangium cellulosum]
MIPRRQGWWSQAGRRLPGEGHLTPRLEDVLGLLRGKSCQPGVGLGGRAGYGASTTVRDALAWITSGSRNGTRCVWFFRQSSA